jgi:phage shock protein A
MITLTQKQEHGMVACESGVDGVGPSTRLVRAAAAEREQLTRQLTRLLTAREKVCEQLARIDASLHQLGERTRLLDQLAAPQKASEPDAPGGNETRGSHTGSQAGVLRGPAIRKTAVEVLLALPERQQAMHYRDWYEAVRAAGYAVAGKDPLAVFLTQITRSPVTRKSTQPGVYELDTTAAQRLRNELERLHEDLRALTATPSAAPDLAAVRSHRTQVHTEISHVENSLTEAEGLLGPAHEHHRPPLAHVTSPGVARPGVSRPA